LNLLEVSEAEVAALKEQSGLADTASLTRILEVLTDAELRLRDISSKKILLEVAMLKAIEARNAVSLDVVLKQLNQLRGQGGAGFQPETAPAAVPQSGMSSRNKPSPVPATSDVQASAIIAPTNVGGYADLAGLWTKLVEAVGRVSPFTRSYLVDANPVSFDKNILTIGFDPEFADHLGLVDNARNHTLLQTKLAELGQANAQIKFIKMEVPAGGVTPSAPVASPTLAAPKRLVSPERSKGESPATSIPAAKEKPASVPFNKNDFKNDPLIQKALEIFKGQIVEVRA
jgi:DNA polymerase-3 subunit gamma/tau